LDDDLDAGRPRAQVGTARAVLEARKALLLIASQPDVIALPRDAVIAAGLAHVAADFTRVTDDRQAPGRGPRPLSFGHSDPLLLRRPQCQRRPSVLDLSAHRIFRARLGVLITRDVVRAFLDQGIAGPGIDVRSDGRTIPRNARTLAFRRPIAARRTGPSRGAICSHPPRTHVAPTAPI